MELFLPQYSQRLKENPTALVQLLFSTCEEIGLNQNHRSELFQSFSSVKILFLLQLYKRTVKAIAAFSFLIEVKKFSEQIPLFLCLMFGLVPTSSQLTLPFQQGIICVLLSFTTQLNSEFFRMSHRVSLQPVVKR